MNYRDLSLRLAPVVWKRVLGLAGLGIFIGMLHNSANPTGVRWTKAKTEETPPHPIRKKNPYRHTALGWAAGGVNPERPENNRSHPYRHSLMSWSASGLQSGASSPQPTTWNAIETEIRENRVILVDSRSRLKFDLEHIPGAVSLPYVELESRISAFIESYPPSTPLVIYCGNTSCSLAKSLALELVNRHGFQNVRYIPGGYLEWRKEETG